MLVTVKAFFVIFRKFRGILNVTGKGFGGSARPSQGVVKTNNVTVKKIEKVLLTSDKGLVKPDKTSGY